MVMARGNEEDEAGRAKVMEREESVTFLVRFPKGHDSCNYQGEAETKKVKWSGQSVSAERPTTKA